MTCKICGGSGRVPVPDKDGFFRVCICDFARRVATRIGHDIWDGVPYIQESPFVTSQNRLDPDCTRTNLFIKGWWPHFLPHLKKVLITKNYEHDLRFLHRVVTDERLLAVYLGKEAYAAKSKKDRDEVVSFNNLGDLVVDPHLLIIRLGFLGHPNRAMASILKEAIMLREAAGKSTWLLEEPDNAYGEGHYSYSVDTGDFIKRLFTEMDISRELGSEEQASGVKKSVLSDKGMHIDSGDDDEIFHVEPPKKASAPVKKPKSVRPPPPMEDDEPYKGKSNEDKFDPMGPAKRKGRKF